ncbi:MAG: hypothetical protein SYR96_36125, partial [Actinomycetota bacterium]|nr:hypothetical protein [Actinomycetota bacterium]
HVLFCTPSVVVAGAHPAPLADGSGAFTVAEVDRGPVALVDGFDAAPLTRAALDADPGAYVGTPRGFTFRVRGAGLTSPVVPADLDDPAQPRDTAGDPLTVAATEIAVDPETGRFLIDPAGLGIRVGELTVDYLLAAPADPVAEAQTFADLAVGLAPVLPAAVVAVATDTRQHRTDPTVLLSATKERRDPRDLP